MPNRIIKESICTSDTIDKLTWFEEVVFYRLIVNCDDYGRFDGRIAIIKNRLFPLKADVTEKSIACAVNKLTTVGLVIPYFYDGKPILQLVTWDKHQTVRNKRSKYPAVNGDDRTTASENVRLISIDFNCMQMNSNAPVIQSNPIQSESESESESNNVVVVVDARAREAENPLEFPPAVKKAVAAYMDMFGSPPGGMVVEDIKDFAETMEADAIIRAFEVAAAENVTKWSYVKGILNRYRQDGVKTKADILRHEAEFQKKKLGAQKPQRPKQYTTAKGVKPSQNDVAQMRKFLDKLKEDE